MTAAMAIKTRSATLPPKCEQCLERPAVRECAAPVPGLHRTCGRRLCARCAVRVGRELDFCPSCAKSSRAASRRSDDRMVVLVDTREQAPFVFSDGVGVEVATLRAGDYSVRGYQDRVAVERKSLSDFIGTVTGGRERFLAELQLLAQLDFAAVVCEGALEDVLAGNYRSRAHPASLLGTAAAITVRFRVPVFFCGTRRAATVLTEGLLSRWWRDEVTRVAAKDAGPAGVPAPGSNDRPEQPTPAPASTSEAAP